MASSSSTSNMLDEHCYGTMFNQNLHEELVSKKNITPEVTFDLEEDEYPSIKEKIKLRGWRRLASPRTKVSKWMIHEFYANAVQFDEEMGQGDQHPYKSYVRGIEVDFSPQNIKKRLSSGQPAQPIQLRRAKLNPLARGWHEFMIHSIIPTRNKSEITIARAIRIHSVIRGENVRVEEIIADNIFRLCKDAGVSIRELIPQYKLITARLMEITRFGRNVQVQQHNEEEEEDQPMPQFEGGNEEDHN
ncbi:hypothetical protein PIB30_098074 [Stylosanthes scabra]|uniref:Putative plant transposon protein domain-containing protein n=1 Tax=Stylosanthes scabra TaxID=79078 RepID=A0ABU6ZVA5_9FABA|nr:hypothetical protein [Stylosanthes scabra]